MGLYPYFAQNSFMSQIYSNIRAIRLNKRLSQQSMANRLHITVSAYSKIERSHTQLTIERLSEIAKIFNVTEDFIRNYHKQNAMETTFIDSMSKDEKLKFQEDIISLFSSEVNDLLTSEYDAILIRFPGEKVPYDEFLFYGGLDLIAGTGLEIKNEEDYLAAPPLTTQNTDEEYDEAFRILIEQKGIMFYYFFKFGLCSDGSLNYRWERFQKEYGNDERFQANCKLDRKKVIEYLKSVDLKEHNYYTRLVE